MCIRDRDDPELVAVEADYAAKETALQAEIDNIESSHPGYDEYRYDLDMIGHDPHELAAYLSAVLQGYTRQSAQAELAVSYTHLPLSLKSDFILSLCELIVGGKEGLQPVQKTIIDRCVRLVYQTYLNDPRPENMPILEDLYNLLRTQEEKEAQYIATALEIYVTGSLNVFNHQSNVCLLYTSSPRVSRRSSSSLVRTRAFPISRSPIPPSRSLRRSPGNTVWIMR